MFHALLHEAKLYHAQPMVSSFRHWRRSDYVHRSLHSRYIDFNSATDIYLAIELQFIANLQLKIY